MDSREFSIFVSYYRFKGGVTIALGNMFVNIGVNRSESGFLPEDLTAHMVAQIRSHIAVEVSKGEDTKVDEEEIIIVSMYKLDAPPKDAVGEG